MGTPPVQTNMPPMPPMNNNVGPRIKPEPGIDGSSASGLSQPPFQPPLSTGMTAQQRAAAHLQANYGPRAAASISAIQGAGPQQGQNPQSNLQQIQAHQNALRQQQQQQQQQQMQLQQQQLHAAGAPPLRPPMTKEQYQHALALQQERQKLQSGVNGAQTDGAGDDFEGPVAILKRFNADGEQELGRMEIDGLIRDKIAAMGQAMEGGGLMLPLRQASDVKKRQRKVKKSATGLVPQHDGPGSDDDEDDKDNVKDEELDEDAINSDLDDPDDGLNDEEDDDEGMGHIMLCMYDKVQRVKNKWLVLSIVF